MKEYDARLETWFVEQATKKEFVIYGYIYDDKKKRFHNTSLVCTSGVSNKYHPVKEGDIVKTRNSVYLLGKPLKK